MIEDTSDNSDKMLIIDEIDFSKSDTEDTKLDLNSFRTCEPPQQSFFPIPLTKNNEES